MRKTPPVSLKQIKSILADLLPPGKYAEQAAQEAAEAAQKTWKPGELVRQVEPPRVPDVDSKFAQGYLENLEREVALNPTPENVNRLKQAELDLRGKLESAPRSAEEQQAARRLEELVGPKEQKPRILTPKELQKKRELNKIKAEFDAQKETADKTVLLPNSDLTKKAAMIAALTSGGLAASSLMPKEAEAGVRGSVAARKKLLEKTERAIKNWTEFESKPAREELQHQLDLDPTGTARLEALRRLAARTDVRKNPLTGEHEFKLFRGDVADRFSESPQSFTSSPKVAKEFAVDYGGDVREVWVPSSKIGSIPGTITPGQFLSSEQEVITKPFKAESSLYRPKEETLHERISKRGTKKEDIEPTDDFISEMLSEGLSKKAAAVGGAAIGAGALAAPLSAQASEGPTVSRSSPEFSSNTTSKTVKDAVAEAESKYGAYDFAEGFQKTLEGLDKYVARPARVAALSALEGKNPLTGAIESISKNNDVEGQQIARKFLEKAEESGFKTRMPVDPRLEQLRQLGVEIEGKRPEEYLPSTDFPAEAPLGVAADMLLDPTNLMGVGLGTKAGKAFSKIRGMVR